MKKLFHWILVLSLGFLFFSCEDENIRELEDKINLKNSESFHYDLHISGDEEGATIIEQANHFEISELNRDETTNWSIVYTYKPEQGFSGSDSVTIETCTGGEGVTCTNLDTLKFIFNVTQ